MEPKKVDLLAKKLRRKNIWGQKKLTCWPCQLHCLSMWVEVDKVDKKEG